jgi:hypothetical protein
LLKTAVLALLDYQYLSLCHLKGLSFEKEKEIGRRESRGEESTGYRVGIKMASENK